MIEKCAILAAGNSTRLPNKLLLPTQHGKVIDHAIRYALEHVKAQDIHLVLKPGSIVEAVMAQETEEEGYGEVIHQYYARGVCEAMKLCHDYEPRSNWLFLLGDNLFTEHTDLFRIESNSSLVGVVNVAKIKSSVTDLDGFDSDRGIWIRRGSFFTHAIAGGYVIRADDLKQVSWDGDLINYFDRISAEPFLLDSSGLWRDLGTPDAYIEYWKGK